MLSAVTLVSGLEQAFHFRSSPMDGPLQLYNALRRIAAGQQPGVDFQFFHGLGVPYLHYLPFRAFGGSFAAAEVTRQALTAVAYPLVLVAFFRAFTRDWQRTLALAGIVMALSLALRLSTILVAINSLLGVRSLFATLVPVVWFAARRSRWRPVFAGLTLGAALLVGTEQGMAAFAAMLVVGAVGIAADDSQRRSRALELCGTLAISLVAFLGFLASVGGIAGMRGALRYNLRLLPGDQYWYFGAPPNPFIGGLGDALRLMASEPLVPAATLAALLLFARHARRLWTAADREARDRNAALAALCLYGLMSTASVLGIFLVGYAQPCARAVLLVAALDLADWWAPRDATQRWRNPVIAAALSIVAMLMSVPVIVGQSLSLVPHVIAVHVVRGEGVTYGGIWPRALAMGDSVVAAAGLTPERPLWSTYAGLVEARHGMFNPSFDYIIHALGPDNRERYVRDFIAAKPRVVQTVVPQFSPFEAWIEQTSWPFYRELITNYRTVDATPWSIFWERLPSPGPRPFVVANATLTRDQDSVAIALPTSPAANPSPVLLEIEVSYAVRNPLSWLPVFGALPRYLVEVDGAVTRGPVTLDPYVERGAFPVVALPGRPLVLRFSTRSLLPGASLDVREVRTSAVPITPGMVPWLQNLITAETRQGATRR